MKIDRQQRLKELIENKIVETQEELIDGLRASGYEVTQSTISRDIKELMLIKEPVGDGRYRYAFPYKGEPLGIAISAQQERLARLFHDAVISVASSENIVVIKTLPGAAGVVSSALDNAEWPELLGTVAGDDTIIAVARSKSFTEKVVNRVSLFLK